MRIEPLRRDHVRDRFDCGEPALNQYLSNLARQNQDSAFSRTFVAVSDADPAGVLGYYSLTVGEIDRANLPRLVSRRLPKSPLPIVRLVRLAVDRSQQGKGLGGHLLIDAMSRCLRVAEDVGVVALIIDAKHEAAKAFYCLRYNFEAPPDQPLTLCLLLPAIRELFETKS